MSEKNYFHTIAKNSFWNTTNVAVTGISSFLFSILLARFLQPENYGRYIYIMTIVNVTVMLLDFGFGQALNKYIPKYFNDEINKKVAVNFFYKITTIQTLASLSVVAIAWALRGTLKSFFPVGNGNFDLIFLAIIAAIIFLTLGRQIINYLNAANGFKKVTLANLVAVIINLLLILFFYKFDYGLNQYLLIPAIVNIVLVSVLLINFRYFIRFSAGVPTKSLQFREVANYTIISYVNLVILYIVYSYSEVFFLKIYSKPEEIAFYTLAFMLSIILSTLPALFHRPLFNAQFELLEKDEDDRADNMTYYSIKFTSVIFLTLAILTCYFMSNVVSVLYGPNYLKIIYIFPFCVFGSMISTILSPLTLKINNMNRIYAMATSLTIIGALLNLFLDYILISRFGSLGAGYANFISQIAVTVMILSFVLHKVKININWLNIAKIFLTNGIFAMLLSVLFLFKFIEPNLLIKLVYAILMFYVYLKLLKTFNIFEANDSVFFDALAKSFPKIIYLKKIMLKLKLI